MTRVSLDIIRATVVRSEHGCDTVLLTINLPSATPKITKEPFTVKFDAEYNTGHIYVKENFGVDPFIVDVN